MSELTNADIQVGKTYRAKRPRRVGMYGELNDRTVLYVSRTGQLVQYDGPAVHFGRRYPSVSMERFLSWASHEIEPEVSNE